MPVVAANLLDAIQLTTDRVALENRTVGEVYSQYVLFIDAIGPIFNTNDQGNRTVRNWLVQANIVLSNLDDFGAVTAVIGPILRQEVVDVVERILYATHVNRNLTSVTAAQQALVLDAWNNSFGALP